MQHFFGQLHRKAIRYVHFKSTPKLTASFAGETDFDLLVHPDDIFEFQRIVSECGGKQRFSSLDKQFPGMLDFLLFFEGTRGLFHLHVHTLLLFGRKYRKQYAFGFQRVEPHIQDHKEYPIKVVSLEFEIFLLLLRIAAKHKEKSIHFWRNQSDIEKDLYPELLILLGQLKPGQFDDWLKLYYPEFEAAFKPILTVAHEGFSSVDELLRNYKNDILPLLEGFKRCIDTQADSEEAQRLRVRFSEEQATWLGDGGSSIALVGIDGAGKSKLIADLTAWLGKKLSVETVYLGFPKYDKLQQFLAIARQWAYRLSLKRVAAGLNEQRHLRSAQLRLANWRRALSLVKRNRLVFLDRYPLREFHSEEFSMDGPRLSVESRQGQRERDLYAQIEDYPNLLIVLNVDPEIALKRKPGNSFEMLKNKSSLVNGLQQSENEIVFINANQPYEAVLAQVKTRIWGRL